MKDFFKYVLATVTGIIAVSIIGTIFMFIVVGAIISSADKQVSVKNSSLLVLEMTQQIVDRAPNDPFKDLDIPGFSQIKSIGLDEINESLKKAVVDDRIEGIYLKLGMVGGGMASVEEIRNMLLEFKEQCDKPVYAYGDFYDQKSYYLATVADQIVIHPLGSVDFRGLGGEMMFYKNALDKIGIEAQIIRQGKFKAAVEPFTRDNMSEENREQQLVYLNSLWNHMLRGISNTRNISITKLNALADSVQTFEKGDGLVANGMVDAAKYKDQVLDDLREITGIENEKGVPIIGVS
ncbi:MAG TPA: S49 family peptidase, partial [Prolixibacteraceae bacterium]|nr:S49 family peptidase [Prolixibacteraceae bacterium]